METQEFLLLLLVAAAIFGILSLIGRELRRGARLAQLKPLESTATNVNAPKMLQWQEVPVISRRPLFWLEALRNCLSKPTSWSWTLRPSVSLQKTYVSHIADPVDGTNFGPGETIIRCACGACYHLESWRWVSDKNAGKCVECRRTGITSLIKLSPA